MILDKVKDHVIPHIVEKYIAKEMWDTLTTLYKGTSVQRKMLLENQLRVEASKFTQLETLHAFYLTYSYLLVIFP